MKTSENTPLENRELNAAESLELIGRMIENTRNRMERNAGLPFLLWGYLTVAFTAAVYALVAATHDGRWNWLWFGLPVCGWLGMYLLLRRRTAEGSATTFIDRVIGQIWTVLGITAFVVTALALATRLCLPILFLIVLLMGIGCALSGLVCRFAPLTVGGFVGIALAPLFLFLLTPAAGLVPVWMAALFAAAFVAMMIVPGHILCYRSNRQARQHHV